MATSRVFIVGSLLTFVSWFSGLPEASSTLTSAVGNLDRCGGRLERALDALQRDSPRRNRLDEEEAGIVYQQKLVSAPLEMTVSRIVVKDSRNQGGLWARVDRCSYEPKSNALQTRVMFADLSVSGVISLLPQEYRAPLVAESCRMSLRLRHAGIEFYTSPIARGRGQMRIRTESSFLEPRFASIYAYGCRPTRVDKQIKRYDKWPQPHQVQQQQKPLSSASPVDDEPYEAAEPRGIAGLTKEEDVTIANEDTGSHALYDSDTNLSIWRKNVWVTKIPRRRKRRRSTEAEHSSSAATDLESPTLATPSDFSLPFAKKATKKFTPSSSNTTKSAKKITDLLYDTTIENTSETTSPKNSLKRETTLSQLLYHPEIERREHEFFENDFDQTLSDEEASSRDEDWLSREAVSNEMEDIFLRGASQALTRYIERELHPAIKETLMLSMGYTISYG